MVAPHAQYALGHIDSLVKGSIVNLPEHISLEEGTFLLLAKEATAWVDSSGVKAGDQVVVLGQGIVGSSRIQVRSATLLHSSSHAHLFEYDGWLLKA